MLPGFFISVSRGIERFRPVHYFFNAVLYNGKREATAPRKQGASLQ
jgi:hypothetical protein